MTRLGAVFWGGLVLASGFATFNVKYAVQGIEDELARARRQTIAEQQEIRVLSAEWAYLNQPERLAELNRNLLHLVPLTAKQMQGRVEEIALRIPRAPAPDAMPTMVAAAPPAATQATMPIPTTSRAETLLAAAPVGGTRAGAIQVANAQAVEGAEHADGAVALAEALRLLGIDAGGHQPRNWLAKAVPIASAHAAEAGGDAANGEPQVADVPAGMARAAVTPRDAASALAEALRVLGGDNGGQAPRVRLAKAAPASLDTLISKIADSR